MKKKNQDTIIWGMSIPSKISAKTNPNRIDGIARIGGFMYPLFTTYLKTYSCLAKWTIFLLCFSTVTLLFVTLSTRGYLRHKLQRWLIRMPLCKRLHRRILWKRWIVWHGFVTDIHPITLNTIILKWLPKILLPNLAARKSSKIASENI